VTANCCKDELRSARRKRTVALDAITTPEQAFLLYSASLAYSDGDTRNDAATDDDPLGYVEDGELREALAVLPGKQRVALHLFYLEGYGTGEIAAITDEKPATVRSHLHRARQTLKAKLGVPDE
jgi:RNA polymerase sigma-70 factor (ECF subfamily)